MEQRKIVNQYCLSEKAEQDIESILNYIKKYHVQAALRWLDELKRAINRIAKYPDIGHYRPDLTEKKIKFWPLGNYLIAYDNNKKPLKFLRILSSYQKLETIFDENKG